MSGLSQAARYLWCRPDRKIAVSEQLELDGNNLKTRRDLVMYYLSRRIHSITHIIALFYSIPPVL